MAYCLGGLLIRNLCGMVEVDINHDLIVSMQTAYIEWKRGMLGKWTMTF